MKKIFLFLCFFSLFNCVGYEPLFSTKKLSYYIESIENVNNDSITKKISKNLDNNKIKKINKKGYMLEISSIKNNVVTSRNSKGQVSTYEMTLDVNVKVFDNITNLLIGKLRLNKKFSYNNQVNKFDLNQYKKNIMKGMINKISEDITIKLQLL
jgi:outer membrane lipopolysaccharide assembly protein LptE/RlpB|tara:strand:- start:37 stop:498 length:462 start_codon:yes stop_codon:yes gene_type:complete